MNRGRSNNNSNRNRNNQVDTFGRMGDPFAQMHQVMRSFGGFGLGSDFFGDRMGDPFEDMMQFSNAHKGLHSGNNGGDYVCQTFVSSSTMGKDGKMKQQSYFENSAGQNRNGHTISQKQQAYKNNDGVRRIAEERMLNDQGRKVVKEKRGNNAEEMTNHYYNMDEDEVSRFDRDWHGVNRQTKFLENAQRAMQGLPGGREQERQLGYEQQPRRDQRRVQQQQSNQRQLEDPRMGGSRGGRSNYGSGYRNY